LIVQRRGMTISSTNDPDIVLVGAGVMSATLGVLLSELEPSLTIHLYEALDRPAQESSAAWNNAGTGHAANCELNYTPQRPDGSIDISRALQLNVEFDLSRQFWSYLVKKGAITDPRSFIHPVPHMSFVKGDADVSFVRKRYEAMAAHHCFHGMEYAEDRRKICDWAPLVMEGRSDGEPVAATRMVTGTDVDYGALTTHLVDHLVRSGNFSAYYRSPITGLSREADGKWRIMFGGGSTSERSSVVTKFVFIGAGGGALPLLQKSGIPEGRGYGGFPVSGIWLRCDVPDVNSRHHAKVYGKVAVGSPPMSVPHLDTRVIDGQRSLLFGPYAGFSTKFLKQGSHLALFESLEPSNMIPMLSVARDNFILMEYLIGQVLQSSRQRIEALQEYYPLANADDWRLQIAGQRVQIVKMLEFGTELVSAADRSLIALLGASPGASTAAFIALSVLEKCFADRLTDAAWLPRLKQIIPSYGISLVDDADFCRRIRQETAAVLKLENV
jgi:malate dehydrogenase (quinone)